MKHNQRQSVVVAVCGILLLLCLVGTSLTILTSTDVNQRVFAQTIDEKPDLNAERAKLRKLFMNKDLERIREFEHSLDRSPSQDLETKFLLKSEICKNLNSVKFDDARHTLYARQCAKTLLKEADQFSVDMEFGLMRILQEVEEYRTGIVDRKLWSIDREERIDLLFHFYSRVHREYDANFDFDDAKNIPLTRVCVPNSNYKCGIRPEEIREPDIRHSYQRAVEQNRVNVRKFNEQRQLHRLIKPFSAFIDQFIIGMYRQSPYEEAELMRVLDRFEIYGDRRAAIMISVKSGAPV
jgi:hypothetical protein